MKPAKYLQRRKSMIAYVPLSFLDDPWFNYSTLIHSNKYCTKIYYDRLVGIDIGLSLII